MSLVHDLRHAVRAVFKRPVFSLIVIVTMAVGIGANVAMFAYLSYFTLPSMEAPEPGRLVWMYHRTEENSTGMLSYPDFLDLEGVPEAFEKLTAYRLFGASFEAPGKTVYAWGTAVTGEYFALFATTPHLGRLLTTEDDRPDAPPVAVLNHFFWQRHFGGDPEILGRTARIDGHGPYTIVGVTPPGFQGPGLATGVYTAISNLDVRMVRRVRDDRDRPAMQILGRLASGVDREKASALVAGLGRGLDEFHPREEVRNFYVKPVTEQDESQAGTPYVRAAQVLMAAVALLLLLACANVANLMLARAAARRREMAIHAAIGADRRSLGGRLLLESLLLSGVGGGLGFFLGREALGVIEGYLLHSVPVGLGDWGIGSSIYVDAGNTALFFVGVTVLTGLLFGAAPVLQLWRTDLVSALKGEAGTEGPRRHLSGRRLLVVAQVAISVVLLVGAGLLARTLFALHTEELGFASEDRFLATVYMPRDGELGDEGAKAIYRDLAEGVQNLPGVHSAAWMWRVPVSYVSEEEIELLTGGEHHDVRVNRIGPGYFDTLGIPLLAGRGIEDADRFDTPGVTVINRTAAETLWPEHSPVGEQIVVREDGPDEPGTAFTVVGVVADSRQEVLTEPLRPLFYFPVEQRFRPRLTLGIHASGSVGGPLHDLLRERFPSLAVISVHPLSEQLRRATTDQQMNADFAMAFGFLGLLLAGVGIFSVMSYAAARRTREFGIRMALGSGTGDVRRLVLGEAGRLLAAGLVLGLLAAAGLTRLVSSVLYGVEAYDPLTFLAVPAVLILVGLLAAALPAARAARVDPITVLREE